MSLPDFSAHSEFFSTAGLSASLFPQTDRYRLFGKVVYPRLAAKRALVEKCYCAENGRTALEPVLLLGISSLQELDGIPDRQAVEMLRYHAGWNFALNHQLGDSVFHPTSLVNFRNRLAEHEQSALDFTTILDALQEAGLVSRQSRQRLDSSQMFGRVARTNRLDCVRESLRLVLQTLELRLGRSNGRWLGACSGNGMSRARPIIGPAAKRWRANWARREPMPGSCCSGCARRRRPFCWANQNPVG